MHRAPLVITLVALVTVMFSLRAEADSGYVAKVSPYSPSFQWNVFSGQYRFLYTHVGDYVLDADGTESPMGSFGEHRLKYLAGVTWQRFHLNVELDIMSGQIFGDTESFASEYRRLDIHDEQYGLGFDKLLLKNAYFQYFSSFMTLRIGQMTSQYGLGIIANAGNDDPWSFEVGRYGDVVDRAMLLITPFRTFSSPDSPLAPLALMASGDMVWQDENAVFKDDDAAYQFSGGLFYYHPKYFNGFVYTKRTQTDADGDELEVNALNLHGTNKIVLSTEPGADGSTPKPDGVLTISYELVYLFGHTTRFQQLGSPEGLDISSFGAVGRVGYASLSSGLETMIEVGYASGDDDPYDDQSNGFYFDPDYNVGMIFFQEMVPLISARSVEISSDPANLAEVPKGLDMVPSQGRVTNALYAFPHLKYTYSHGGVFEKAMAHVGVLVLTAPAGYSHSYYSFVHGGYNANHLGAATDSNFLGMELLLDLKAVVWPWQDHVSLTAGVAQALFIPGSALEDETGAVPDAVWKIMATLSLDWH